VQTARAELVNISGLRLALDNVPASGDQFTSASWNTLVALTTGLPANVRDITGMTQSEVDDLASNINISSTIGTDYGLVDISELLIALQNAEIELVKTDYWTAGSLDDLLLSMEGLTSGTARDEVLSQDEVDALTSAITSATNDLESIFGDNAGRYALLVAARQTALALNEDDYTIQSWEAMLAVLDDTQDIDQWSTAATINAAINATNNARLALVNIVALREALLDIPSDEDNFTVSTWDILEGFVSTLTADEIADVRLTTDMTQGEVNSLVSDIETAILGLVDISELRSILVIAEAELLKTDVLTSASLAGLALSLGSEQSDTIRDTDLSQDEVDILASAIATAIAELVDITELRAVLILAEDELLKTTYWTTASRLGLQASLAGMSSATVLDTDLSQDEVNALVTAINTAIDALVSVYDQFNNPRPSFEQAAADVTSTASGRA
jgi:hypothetical protein